MVRLDEKSRVILRKEVRELLGIHGVSKKSGAKGSLIAFKTDGKRAIIEKVK